MASPQNAALTGSPPGMEMKLDFEALHWHLRRISCNGQISDVVFSGAFQASAISYDGGLLVMAPPLDGASSLRRDIGVPDLGLLLKRVEALRLPGVGGRHEIVLRLTEGQLVMSSEHAEIEHPLVAPRCIGTWINRSAVEKLEQLIGGEASEVDLDVDNLFDGVRATENCTNPLFELLWAPGVVRMRARKLPLGDGKAVSLAGDPRDERCDLRFEIPSKFRDICQTFEDSTRAILRVDGPRDFLMLEAHSHTDAVYRYLFTACCVSAGQAAA